MNEKEKRETLIEMMKSIRVLVLCSFLLVIVLVVNGVFYDQIYGKSQTENAGIVGDYVVLNATSLSEQEKTGKTLFKSYCASCHNKNMKADMTGPALGGVEERWESKEDLYAWIRNSQEFLQSGDEYANQLYKKWNKSRMLSFQDFKDDEIDAILAYVNKIYEH